VSICPDCCKNALFLIVRSERYLGYQRFSRGTLGKKTCRSKAGTARKPLAPGVSERDLSAKLSAALLVAKFTDIHIEKLEEVTLSFTKYQSTLLPIILFRNAGPDKNESRQKFILFKE